MFSQSKEQFLISELAEKANISVRTIRYYIEEGLLPSPQLRGRYSLYDEDYLHRLMLIKHLQEAHLPLKEIRLRIEKLSVDEVIELLINYGENIESTSHKHTLREDQSQQYLMDENTNAKDYIARILNAHTSSQRKDSFEKNISPASPPSQPSLRSEHSLDSLTQESDWRRIVLTPGVELHIDQTLYKIMREKVHKLIGFASDLFTK